MSLAVYFIFNVAYACYTVSVLALRLNQNAVHRNRHYPLSKDLCSMLYIVSTYKSCPPDKSNIFTNVNKNTLWTDGGRESVSKYNADLQAHLFSLRGSSRRGGGGEAFLPLGELAVGLSQSPLQLIDAGLVFLENVLWLVQELLHPHGDVG